MERFIHSIDTLGIEIPALRRVQKNMLAEVFIYKYDSNQFIQENWLEEIVSKESYVNEFMYDEYNTKQHTENNKVIKQIKTILCIKNRYFAIDWELGTDGKLKIFNNQPYEVIPAKNDKGCIEYLKI